MPDCQNGLAFLFLFVRTSDKNYLIFTIKLGGILIAIGQRETICLTLKTQAICQM